MSKSLVDAILPAARTAVAPVPCEDYRLDPAASPSVWIRPPSSLGPAPDYMPGWKRALLTLDIWGNSWQEVEDIRVKLEFLDGHSLVTQGTLEGILYRLQGVNPVFEPDAAHLVATYAVTYFDMGVA